MAIAISNPLEIGRLGKQTRKAVLVTHIIAAGTWIGLDVAMAAIVFTALGTDDVALKALCYQALERFVYWPIFASSVICLASGVLLGLGTSYGLARCWWVATKLVLNSVLTTLVIFALRPGVFELAEQGRRAAAGQAVTFVESGMMFPPIVSSTALLGAFVLSVFKPWGRIRRAPLQRGGGRGAWANRVSSPQADAWTASETVNEKVSMTWFASS